jgi:3alpha(or 20beta)-hydroxysteroid dehydrogenase
MYLPLDVTRPDDWSRAIDEVRAAYGLLNVLVNNAGVVSRVGIMQIPLNDWSRVMEINVTGALLGMRAAAPLMRESGGGSIVNISSTSGLVGHSGVAYVASKWALRGITKTAAMEFLDWGIRANSVHPSQVSDTRITDGAPLGHQEANAKLIPYGRLARPDEVANAVLFLACDESSYITGTEIVVDCGYTSFAMSRLRGLLQKDIRAS